MEPISADRIKTLALIAISTDASLTKRLVLKGGNLLDLIYDAAPRASVDLDFSMEKEFCCSELTAIEGKFANALTEGLWGRRISSL
jgi:predicted nucleotidyltransferase component of viral defense system